MRYCTICHKQAVPGNGTFFNAPRDPNKRAEWAKLCKREFNTSTRVCMDHFAANDIVTMGSRYMLLPRAVPIVHQQEESQQMFTTDPLPDNVKNFQVGNNGYQLSVTSVQIPRFFTYEELTPTAASIRQEPQLKEQQFPTDIPLDESRREKWRNACKKDFKTNSRICADHFSKDDLINAGRRMFLMPNATPIVVHETEFTAPVVNSISNAVECKIQSFGKSLESLRLFSVEELTSSAALKSVGECQIEKTCNLLNTDLNDIPPQLDEPIVQMPVAKTVSCSGFTQTNIRLCGLVEASDLADEFRFNCFYCCEVFPLEKWKNFVNHLKDMHFNEEGAFQTSEYLSKEHDYTPVSLPPPTPSKAGIEPLVYNAAPAPEDPLGGSVNNPFESIVFNSSLSYTNYEKKAETNFVTNSSEEPLETYDEDSECKPMSPSKSDSKLSEQKTSTETPSTVNQNSCKTCVAIANQETPTEISFEYTPTPIVDLLLDNMKSFPVLWQFDEEPFNEDFFEAVEELCNAINERFSLNIDNLKMRRSINRILRFFCYLYPNENNDQFTYYYDKCATFLPSVNEIAYARCSHCYVCYSSDLDLKLHLVEEQKYLEWPHKCSQCKECFRLRDEFEFHKHLPHYDEIFRCQPCKLSFFRRLSYKKHMVEEHHKDNEPGRFKCDICDRALETLNGLRTHKKTHGEAPHKCHLCPRTFHEKSKLNIHLKRHRQEPDFMCEVCGKKFFIQKALQIHMTKHTGEKVTCKICNLRLRKSSLGRHLRTVHVAFAGPIGKRFFDGKQIRPGRILRAPKRSERKRKRGDRKNKKSERKYKCKICKVFLDDYKLVLEHKKEMHPDLPRWPCKMCTTEFSAKVNLKSHYRKKHNFHPLQIFKLLEENEDLSKVLSIEVEDSEENFDNSSSGNIPESTNKRDIESSEKSDLLPDEIYFAEEKIHSSTIQEEIMKAVDETQHIKIDYMNDMFTEFLE